jgi:hypothetical protein
LRIFLKFFDGAAGVIANLFIVPLVEVMVRGTLQSCNDVHEAKGRSKIAGESGCLPHQRPAFRCSVDRAEHFPAGKMVAAWLLFDVRRSPNRTSRVVQYLRRDRTEQKSPEWTISVRRHHNQIHAVVMGKLIRHSSANFAILHNSKAAAVPAITVPSAEDRVHGRTLPPEIHLRRIRFAGFEPEAKAFVSAD